MTLTFERIDTNHRVAKIPGGWVLESYHEYKYNIDFGGGRNEEATSRKYSTCFVPDPDHTWMPGRQSVGCNKNGSQMLTHSK